jgi:LysM repeat protein
VLVLVLLLAAVTLVVTLFVGAERVGLELAGLSGILTRGGSSPATVPAPTATPEATEVPTTAPSATPEPTETPTLEPTPEPADTSPEPTPVPLVHTVRFGETLRSIATQYGVTAEEIMEANGLSSDAIRAEQELVIPGRFESTPTAQARGPSVHIVQQGENLILIAQKYRVGVADLMAANNLASADLIRVGQTLQIPGAGTPPAPGPTEAPLATATPLLPTATLVATVMMTPTPAPQPTPSHEFAAPNLLTPAMGAVVKGAEDVLLNWTSVGLLADDTWYVIKIWRDDPSLPTPSTGWTRTTAWRILASFQPGAGETSRRFYWSVTVMRAREGQAPVAVSPASEERWFEWE